MPPPGHEPFLRAICADPEDDTVRLVYADWLDENGDPDRAEFIRLQIQRAQLKAGGESPKELKDRDVLLRRLHEERRRRELPLKILPDTWQRFWRGFVSGVTANAGYLLQNADAIFTAAPIQFLHVRRLTDGTAERFGEMDGLRHIHGLTVSDSRIWMGWSKLLAEKTLVNLRWLELRAGAAFARRSEDAGRVVQTRPR
jgi:uncharacterized protein (TIGR02996 family)